MLFKTAFADMRNHPLRYKTASIHQISIVRAQAQNTHFTVAVAGPASSAFAMLRNQISNLQFKIHFKFMSKY
jgi:hypothetical protein